MDPPPRPHRPRPRRGAAPGPRADVGRRRRATAPLHPRARPRRARLKRLAFLLVLALAGCGQSDDRDTVRAVTERFYNAYGAEQGDVACSTIASETRKQLESEESEPCPEAIGSIDLSGGAISKVAVQMTNAKVDLASGESVFLSREQPGWRITALGCRSAGRPTDLPFDCELEA